MVRGWPVLVLAASGMSACMDQGLKGNQDGSGPIDGPEIEVLPTLLDYGTTRPDAEERFVRRFTIRNVGTVGSTLDVERVYIEGEGSFAFSLLEEWEETALDRDDEADVEVVFEPSESVDYTARAVIASNDADEGVTYVDLLASARIPVLQISPDPLDLGTVWLGCSREETLYFSNVGNDVLDVTRVVQEGGGFELLDLPEGAFTIEPGDTREARLSFTPTAEGTFEGTVTVSSNEAIAIREAAHVALATPVPFHTDVFEVPNDPPVDILFYVDQSYSMEDDQWALGNNFAAFIDQLGDIAPDWQVLVAIEDDGCTRFPILNPDTSDYETVFMTAVTQGDGGIWTEAGLTVATNALEATGDGECNAGFLRPDSMVHAILVSDEPEQSTDPWDHYVTRMKNAVGDPGRLHVSAIAGDFPAGCSTPSNSAGPGEGYWETVTATSGLFLSICSDWWTSVDALADITLTRDTFWLTHDPQPDTVQVRVNGTARTDWTWDAEANAVVFSGPYLPIEGDVVEVDYTELLVCP